MAQCRMAIEESKREFLILVLRKPNASSVSFCCTMVMLLGILNSFLTHKGHIQYSIIPSELERNRGNSRLFVIATADEVVNNDEYREELVGRDVPLKKNKKKKNTKWRIRRRIRWRRTHN